MKHTISETQTNTKYSKKHINNIHIQNGSNTVSPALSSALFCTAPINQVVMRQLYTVFQKNIHSYYWL